MLECRYLPDPGEDQWDQLVQGDIDSSSSERQLKLLGRRIEALAGIEGLPLPAAAGDYVLCGFGCVESLALAHCSLPPVDRERLDELFRSIPIPAANPRLVVLNNVLPDRASYAAAQSWHRFQRELDRVVQLPRQSPVLPLRWSRPEDATAEVVAAVLAMAP
jgi:hypothetical protein